jgi:hypothetical protein
MQVVESLVRNRDREGNWLNAASLSMADRDADTRSPGDERAWTWG